MAQSVQCPTSAQVMIPPFLGSSPSSDSVLTGQSLEPALDSVSPSLSTPSPFMLRLSLSKINVKKLGFFIILNNKLARVPGWLSWLSL